MSALNEGKRASNVIAVDFRRRDARARVTNDGVSVPLPSVYSKITDNDEVEYGMEHVDSATAPRLMRGLLALLDELMDVASF